MTELRKDVLIAVNSREVTAVTRNMNEVICICSKTVIRDILPVPGLSGFFLGREKERQKLLDILDRQRSASICQHGEAVKTELMVYFAEYAR